MFLCVFLALLGCVSTSPSKRIIHGTPMTPGEMPFLGILDTLTNGYWFHMCGVMLITPNKVVTGAHCLTNEHADNMRVVMGEHNINVDEGTEQYLTVLNYTLHPGWVGDDEGFPHDLAVITLRDSADTNSSVVETIPIAKTGANFTDTDCTLAGWGSIIPGGSIVRQDTPYKATFPVISNKQCNDMWSSVKGAHILPGHVCMYSPTGGEACHYDYGGPMVCNGILAGVISWGDIMCSVKHPSVMTSIAYYHDWIVQHL